MDGSALEAAPFATQKPDNEDTDIVRKFRPGTIHLLFEPFCTRGQPEQLPGNGGLYNWTCLLCSTEDSPFILSGSSSKVPTHYQTSGGGQVLGLQWPGLCERQPGTGWVGVELSQIAIC